MKKKKKWIKKWNEKSKNTMNGNKMINHVKKLQRMMKSNAISIETELDEQKCTKTLKIE